MQVSIKIFELYSLFQLKIRMAMILSGKKHPMTAMNGILSGKVW
jgi:hypothetical protein